MKKVIVVFVAAVLCLSLVACDCGPSVTYRTIRASGYSYEVDSTWIEEKVHESTYGVTYRYYPEEYQQEAPWIFVEETRLSTILALETQREQIEELKNHFKGFIDESSGVVIKEDYSNVKEGSFGSKALMIADYFYYVDNKLVFKGKKVVFFVSSTVFITIEYYCLSDDYNRYRNDMMRVINSIKPL